MSEFLRVLNNLVSENVAEEKMDDVEAAEDSEHEDLAYFLYDLYQQHLKMKSEQTRQKYEYAQAVRFKIFQNKLEDEIKKLKYALSWYANPDNWAGDSEGNTMVDYDGSQTDVRTISCGKRAREALGIKEYGKE